jgi:hypothetical protein
LKVLRTLDFSVGVSGDFTIHLADPVPRDEFDVQINIDNFGSKSFFAHLDDAVLLPVWNGQLLNSLRVGCTEFVARP